jgi:hypothetical protein
MPFATVFPRTEIVAALRRRLGWARFKLLIPLKDSLQRDFYAEMCRLEGWSTRELAEKIDGMLYERTALSKKPEQLIRQELAALRDKDEVTPAWVCRRPARSWIRAGAGSSSRLATARAAVWPRES